MSDVDMILDRDVIIEIVRKSDNRILKRSFVYSDYSALESFLAFATACKDDEDIQKSFIGSDPSNFEVHRVGAILYDGDYIPCPCKLFDCASVFSFVKVFDYSGRYNVLDYLEHYKIVNEFSDNWNVMSTEILLRKPKKAPQGSMSFEGASSASELASDADEAQQHEVLSEHQ